MFSLDKENHAPVVLTLLLHTMAIVGLGLIGLGEAGIFSAQAPDANSPAHIRASVVNVARPDPSPEPQESQPAEPVVAAEIEPQPQAPALPEPDPEPEPEPVVSQQPEVEAQPVEGLQQAEVPKELPLQQELQEVQQRVQQILDEAQPVDLPSNTDIASSIDERINSLIEPTIEQSTQALIDSTDSYQQLSSSRARELALTYLARNKKLVERNFNVGGVSQKQLFAGLNVLIKIKLDNEGKLLGATIIKSSGNDLFDNKAINAVRRVGQFIIPSDPELSARYFREIVMDYSL